MDRAEALRDRFLGDLVNVVVEEAGVVTLVWSCRNTTWVRDEGVARLVKRDVTIGSDAEYLEVDASGILDRRVIISGRTIQIIRLRIRGLNCALGEINVVNDSRWMNCT